MASPTEDGRVVRQKLEPSSHNKDQKADDTETVGSTDLYSDSLCSQYNCADLSDIVLQVGDVSYHAHKFLLAHFSGVMRTMLTSSRWADSRKRTVELGETPECAAVFDGFLKFMYCGKVELNIDRVLPMLALADKYNVSQLRLACSNFMLRQVSHLGNLRGAMQWWEHAKTYKLTDIGDECLELIKESMDDTISSPQWANLSIDQLCTILESSDVVVSDEYTLYKGVETWLQSDNHKGSTSVYLDRILPLLRFSHMTAPQIDKIEKSSLCQRNAEKFTSYILAAYKFFAMGSKSTGFSNKDNPREYGKQKCSGLSINLRYKDIPFEFSGSEFSVKTKSESSTEGIPKGGGIPNARAQICRMDSNRSNGLIIRICEVAEGRNYSVKVRLSDAVSGKVLSIIRGTGKVGEKSPHIAYVDYQDESSIPEIAQMFTDSNGTNTTPIICAFLGILSQPNNIRLIISLRYI